MPTSPAIDAVFTIAPPPASRMARAAYLATRKTPRRLTAMTLSNSSGSIESRFDCPAR